MGDKALVLRKAELAVRDRNVSEKAAAQALMVLPVPERALTLAASFYEAFVGVESEEADRVAESTGRRFERILDETGADQAETLGVMIKAGDTTPVLAMVRGHAGEWSSTAELLTRELVAELFDRDPDMNDRSKRTDRLITLCYTLICETRENHAGVNRFFRSPAGRTLLGEIAELAGDGGTGSDDNAIEILRAARSRGIRVPKLREPPRDPNDEDEEIE